MRKRLIIATALFLSGSLARGQEPAKQWSLEECIRYAIEHNKEHVSYSNHTLATNLEVDV